MDKNNNDGADLHEQVRRIIDSDNTGMTPADILNWCQFHAYVEGSLVDFEPGETIERQVVELVKYAKGEPSRYDGLVEGHDRG